MAGMLDMGAFGMLKLIILIVVFDVALCKKYKTYCDEEFRKRGYIPKFADGLKNTDLKVTFGKRTVKCGETVTFAEALFPPTLQYDLTKKCVNVSIIAFTPDDIVNAPYPYWLAFNIPATSLKEGYNNGGLITDKLAGNNAGDVIATYLDPDDPTAGSGVRNVTGVYFVYCQCKPIIELNHLDKLDKLHFEVKPYMTGHGLKCPVAGFFHEFSLTGLPIPTLPVQVDPIQVPLPDIPYGNKVPVPLPLGLNPLDPPLPV